MPKQTIKYKCGHYLKLEYTGGVNHDIGEGMYWEEGKDLCFACREKAEREHPRVVDHGNGDGGGGGGAMLLTTGPVRMRIIKPRKKR